MRIIVPLQGVVQGRGGVFWGSIIPCGLFYLLQLYIRQRRPNSPDDIDADTRETGLESLSRASSNGDVHAAHYEHPQANNEHSSTARSSAQLQSPRREPFISPRAIAVLNTGFSPYSIGWREYYQNPYHTVENPDGIIQLGLAENRISLDLLQNWLKSHPQASKWDEDHHLTLEDVAPYQYSHGIPAFKSVLATLLEELVGDAVSFDPDNIVVTAGATAALELLAFALGEARDAFLVPSPYYPGFDRDMKWRTGIELVPVYCPSSEGFRISRTALEKAFRQTRRRGIIVRAVLLTSPGNPVGHVMDAQTLQSVFDFAMEKGIHVICDEVYAGSVFRGAFIPAAQVLASGHYDVSLVHIVYGLSKDFGIPGFRVGLIYSMNNKILAAVRNLTRFCTVSSHTQRELGFLLQDKEFVRRFLKENQRRLCDRYDATVKGLKLAGVRCAESYGGLYCWVDMRHLLKPSSMEGEKKLWETLLHEVKVSLTPGSECHYQEAGWFRLCFASVDEETLEIALKRVQWFTREMQK